MVVGQVYHMRYGFQNLFSWAVSGFDFLYDTTIKKHPRGVLFYGAAGEKVRFAHPLRLRLRDRSKNETFFLRHLRCRFDSGLTCPRESASLYDTTIKKHPRGVLFFMVPLVRIGLTTPPLPRVCSTTEPQRQTNQQDTIKNICVLQAKNILFSFPSA